MTPEEELRIHNYIISLSNSNRYMSDDWQRCNLGNSISNMLRPTDIPPATTPRPIRHPWWFRMLAPIFKRREQ
jgi:hypothetical protein